MKHFEKITKKIYLKQHRTYIKTNAYKRFLKVCQNPRSFGLRKKDFSNKKILDLGCGSTGYFQKAMEILNCHSVTCCDLGKKYISDLKKFEKKYIKRKNFLIYKSQNIKKLDFKDSSFDIVFFKWSYHAFRQFIRCQKKFIRSTKSSKEKWLHLDISWN